MFDPQPHRFIKSFPIDIPGRNLIGKLYFASTRTSGRRILVEENGKRVYDTDNCYDLANATNVLDGWCLRQLVCAHCGAKGLTSDHGQDAETGYPICSECCAKATGGQQASMSAADLAASVEALAEVQREKPADLAAVAVDEVNEDDGFPNEFPF